MPRGAREKSATGIYHIMLRGVDRRVIFEDEDDALHFIGLLRADKVRCGFALYGYCCMGNHVHLLLKEAARPSMLAHGEQEIEIGPGEPLEIVMKRITVAYVMYFNRRHHRTGHLFQDRYRSEAIGTDAYLLQALRYIHRNPVKAGLCETPGEYALSSWRDYMGERDDGAADTDFILGMMSREELAAFTMAENEDRFMDLGEKPRRLLTDAEVQRLMKKKTGCATAEEFRMLKREARTAGVKKLARAGAQITQLSRVTGLSRPAIYAALKR